MSAQKANAIRTKWERINKDLKNEVTEQVKNVVEVMPSNCMSTAICLNDDMKAIKELWARAEALTEEIKV